MKPRKAKINKIRKLKEEGLKPRQIAIIVGIKPRQVYYWSLTEDERKKKAQDSVEKFRNLPKEKKKEIYKKRYSYLKNYIRKRYHEDPIFREKQKVRARRYSKKKYWSSNSIEEVKGGTTKK